MKLKDLENNTKNNLCRFLIVLFLMLLFVCFVVFKDTKSDYISEKANVAQEKIDAIRMWNHNPDVDTSELDKIELKRYICVGGIIISIIGVIICCIILYSEPSHNNYK